MKNYIFVANDPGGFDAIYPVALEMSKVSDVTAKLILTGRAADKQPLFRMREDDVVGYINERIEVNDRFVLVTGTSWDATVELECIRLCKKSGITTISILDYWCNYRSRFKYNDEYIFPDYYFVMDQLAFDEAVNEGVDSAIMRIVGNPGLDRYVHKTGSTKKVLFISQPLSSLYKKEETGYDEFDAFNDVIKACKELMIVPYIKFHPKETEEMKRMYQKYAVDGDLDEIATGYDAIIGMTTMGLLQCSLMGIPVISYEPNLVSDDLCIINKLKIVNGAFKYSDLLNQLKLITGRSDSKNLPFWFDGQSTERCAKELLELGEET